jgi:hypothetical protein
VDESDDGVTWTAVAAGDLMGTAKVLGANGDCDKMYVVGYKGKHRYIRPTMTMAGSHATGTACFAFVQLGYGRHLPSTNPGTSLTAGS